MIQANIVRHWRSRGKQHHPAGRRAVAAPVMANRVGALLSQMFRFAVTRGMLEASPFVALGRPGGSEKARNRQLTTRKSGSSGRTHAGATQRRSAHCAKAHSGYRAAAGRSGPGCAERSDLERKVWTIPPERSKNGQEHEVPLSGLALTLLRHLRRRFGETDYLIPSRCWKARDAAPITVRALSQGVRDCRKHFGLSRFTTHDLRRTAASLMTANGIPRLRVEKLLIIDRRCRRDL